MIKSYYYALLVDPTQAVIAHHAEPLLLPFQWHISGFKKKIAFNKPAKVHPSKIKLEIMKTDQVNVRYMVEDVDASVEFYTKYLGFTQLKICLLKSPG